MGSVTTIPSDGGGVATSIGGETVEDVSLTTSNGSIFKTVTGNAATDTFTRTAHGLVNNDRINFGLLKSGVIPAGLNTTTFYYVVNKTDDTFQVSLTLGGAAIDFTTNGTNVFICVFLDSSTDVFTLAGHGLSNNDRVVFTATSLPATLSNTQPYWIINATANTFQISLTQGGAAVGFTTNGYGLYVSKLELIWSYEVPPLNILTAKWEINAKTPSTMARRGYFIQDTCYIRLAGNVLLQSITTQTVYKAGNSDFGIVAGVDETTQKGQIFVYGYSGVTINWSGYVKYLLF